MEMEAQADAWQKQSWKEWIIPFSSVASPASVKHTLKLPSVNQYWWKHVKW